jgi:hypothetical protein
VAAAGFNCILHNHHLAHSLQVVMPFSASNVIIAHILHF